MQNNREHIDDFLKDKMQDMHFDVNESHWDDAVRRLDEEDKKKKPFWWLFVGLVLLIGAGITALTQINTNKQATQNAQNEMVKTSSSKEASATPIQNKDNNLPNAIINQNKKETTILSENQEGQTTENAVSSKSPVNENNNSSSTGGAIINSKPSKREISSGTTKSESLVQSKTPSKIAKAKTNKAQKGTGTGGKNSIEANSLKKKTEKTGAEAPILTAKNTSKKQASGSNKNDTPIKEKEIVKTGETRVYKTPADYQKLNPRYVPNLENYTYTVSAIPLSKQKSDSIRNLRDQQNKSETDSTIAKKSKEKEPFVQSPSGFYLYGALGLARGYQGNTNANPNWGFSPALGVGYERTFSDRMNLYLSAYMSYISNLNVKETSKSVSYSFDRDSTLISVTRKNLLQLHLPVQFAYKLKPRLSVLGGFGLNLALNSVSLYEDSKQSTTQNQFGYMKGFSFLDVNGNFGVEYSVLPKLKIGAMYQQGLIDMTKNEYFNNQQKDLNARFGVYLRYKLKK